MLLVLCYSLSGTIVFFALKASILCSRTAQFPTIEDAFNLIHSMIADALAFRGCVQQYRVTAFIPLNSKLTLVPHSYQLSY
jgi:hypothetical protein